MERYLHSPRALAAVSLALGILTVLLLSLFDFMEYECMVWNMDAPGRLRGSCAEWSNGRFTLRFDPSFEPHYLLIGAAVALATYALLVLAILSVRAIRGEGRA